LRVDQASFRELKPKYGWLGRLEDYAEYRRCAQALDQAGRLDIDDVVLVYGYARVIQVLAATIIDFPHEYEGREIGLALQIPMPIRRREHYTNIHRAYVQAEFLRLVKPHLVEA